MKFFSASFLSIGLVGITCIQPPVLVAASAPSSLELVDEQDIKRDLWLVKNRLQDGTNELRNAGTRFNKSYLDKSFLPLTEASVVLSYVRLHQSRYRMEEVPGKIYRVKSVWYQDAFYKKNNLNREYLGSRTSADGLENDLQNFVGKLSKLHPCNFLRAYLNYRSLILGNKDFDQLMNNLGDKIAQISGPLNASSLASLFVLPPKQASALQSALQGGDVLTLLKYFGLNPQDPKLRSAIASALTQGLDPLTQEEAQAALDAYARGDVAALRALLAKHPGNSTLNAMLNSLSQEMATATGTAGPQASGSSPANTSLSASGAPVSPVAKTPEVSVAPKIENVPNTVSQIKPVEPVKEAVAIPVPAPPAVVVAKEIPAVPVAPPPVDKFIPITAEQKTVLGSQALITDDPDWPAPTWNAAQNVFKQGPMTRRTYLGKNGGRLIEEREITRQARVENNKLSPWDYTLGRKIQWALQLDKKAGGFELINMSMDGEDFIITSWSVHAPTGQVLKSGTSKDISIDFPASGRYTVRASGKTKMWNSPFSLEEQVDVVK
jgi:hypothetical protein